MSLNGPDYCVFLIFSVYADILLCNGGRCNIRWCLLSSCTISAVVEDCFRRVVDVGSV